MFTVLPIECRYDLICIFTYFRPQQKFYPLRAPWGPLRAPDASKTCLPYSPLNVDMICYAFLHTLDLNGTFTPWGPPEGPLRIPEGSWGLENMFTVLPIECRYDLICIFTYFRPQRKFYPLRAPWGPLEGPLRAPWGPLRAPEASKTCLPYYPLNVDRIWYAFLHTLDLNGTFTP